MTPVLAPRTRVRFWHRLASPLFAVAASACVGAIFLRLVGFSPLSVYDQMIRSSFGSWFGFSDTLVSATPLILTGLAAAVAFRLNLYNIGAEGQLYMGAIAASGAAILLGDMPRPVMLSVVVLAGMLGGVAWILLPALARAFLGTSEIITTLLFNYVALLFMQYLIMGSFSMWRDRGSANFPQGTLIPESAVFPRLDQTRIHMGLILAVVAVAGIYLLLTRTSFGYDIRVLADSESAGRYAGIPLKKTLVIVMLMSGALAGLAGASEVAGRAARLDPMGLAINLGYTGIIVAALARLHPLGVVVVAVLLGGIENAATALQTLPGERVPYATSLVLQGGMLLFLIAGEVFITQQIRFRRQRETRELEPVSDVVADDRAVEGAGRKQTDGQ